MTKNRAMPILAGAAVALSLAACQGMGGAEEPTATTAQYPAEPAPGAAQAPKRQAAVSPDLMRNVQRNLSQRGYNSGPADGVYGPATEQALSSFQRDQKLKSSGQIDSQTLAALGVGPEGTQAAAGPAGPQPSQQAARPEPGAQQRTAGLSQEQVRGLQQELASRGYDTGTVDGRWGSKTEQAVRDFQEDQNLPASGRPDQQTMAALGVEGAGTQTGEMPAERTPSPQPGGAQEGEMQRQEGMIPERTPEETGQLPETRETPIPAEPIPPSAMPEEAPPEGTSPGAPSETR